METRCQCRFHERTLGYSTCTYAEVHLKAIPGNRCDAQKVAIATVLTALRKKRNCLFTQLDLWIRSHSFSNELLCLCEWLQVN